MKEKFLLAFLVFLSFIRLPAQDIVITEKNGPAVFPIVSGSGPTAIYVDKNDHWLMYRAAELLRQDLEMLTGQKTTIITTWPKSAEHLIIIGSLDSSEIIKQAGRRKENSNKWSDRSMGKISDTDRKGSGKGYQKCADHNRERQKRHSLCRI